MGRGVVFSAGEYFRVQFSISRATITNLPEPPDSRVSFWFMRWCAHRCDDLRQTVHLTIGRHSMTNHWVIDYVRNDICQNTTSALPSVHTIPYIDDKFQPGSIMHRTMTPAGFRDKISGEKAPRSMGNSMYFPGGIFKLFRTLQLRFL